MDKETNEIISKCSDPKAGFELVSSGGISLVIGLEKGVDHSFDRFFGDEPE